MGLLLCLAWIPGVLVAGSVLPRLMPAPLRRRALGRTGASYVLLAALVLIPMALAAIGGWQVRSPGDPLPPYLLPVGMTLVLGLPAAGFSWAVWRWASRQALLEHREPGPPICTPVPVPGDIAARHRPTAPLPGATAQHAVHRINSRLRRARTTAFVLAAGCSLLVLYQVMALFLLAGVVLILVLRYRARLIGSRALEDIAERARASGWILTRDDTTRVADHFPAAPFLRSTSDVTAMEQPVVVDGRTEGRRWWAVEQHGVVSDLRWAVRRRRTVFVTELSGPGLPSVTVAGRDNFSLIGWLMEGIRLESYDLNQRLIVMTASGGQAATWAVMNPRMMEHILAGLPDGAALVFGGNTVSVVMERSLRTGDLEVLPAFLLGAVALVPAYLCRDREIRWSSPGG